MDYTPSEKELNFIPLIGGIGQKASYYQVNVMVDRLAEKFGGNSIFLNAPAFINHLNSYKNITGNDNYQIVKELWGKIDLAVIGLGKPISSSEILKSEISSDVVQSLMDFDAVGDILGQFFNQYGEICVTDLEKQLIGMKIEELKRIKNVVCLSGGEGKAKGIIAAAKVNFFNTLVTDQLTATDILDSLGG
jgi:DNA-binding transcriptional regulator LsrR (DeoR family)